MTEPQLDLFDSLGVLRPMKPVRGIARYEVAYLSDGSHGGNRRQHALLDGAIAICGASPSIKPLTWQAAYGDVTCPKCRTLIRYRDRVI